MKILMQHDGFFGNGNFNPRLGLVNVFRALGHTVIDWDFKAINPFDMFTLAERDGPLDLFIGQTYNANRAVCKNIESRPYLKVLLQCSTWGEILKDIDLTKYPILVPTEDEKRLITTLSRVHPGILVYQNYAPDRVADCLGGWGEAGCLPISNLNAADYFVYNKGRKLKEFETDVAYVGGRWPYKGNNIDKYILPLLNERTAPKVKDRKVSVHIYGGTGWQGVAQYRGFAKDEDVRDIFASAICCPNVSEPHSNEWGFDVVERPFKVALAGGLCILDNVKSLIENFTTTQEPMLLVYHSYKELCEIIGYFKHNDFERPEFINRSYEHVLKNHTYFNRVQELFYKLGYTQEAWACRQLHKHIIDKELINAN